MTQTEISIMELADLRNDIQSIHNQLDQFKQESVSVVQQLSAAIEDAEGEKLEALEDTQEMGLAVYMRIQSPEEAQAPEARPDDEEEEVEE